MPFAHRYCPCQVPSFQFGPCHPHTSSLLIFSETWIDQSFPSSLSTTPWHLAQHTSHPNETLLELPDCISETSPPPFMDSIQRSELAPTQNSKSWLSRRVTYHPTYPSCKGWTQTLCASPDCSAEASSESRHPCKKRCDWSWCIPIVCDISLLLAGRNHRSLPDFMDER